MTKIQKQFDKGKSALPQMMLEKGRLTKASHLIKEDLNVTCINYKTVKTDKASETAPWLGELFALADNLGSVASTLVVTQNHLEL